MVEEQACLSQSFGSVVERIEKVHFPRQRIFDHQLTEGVEPESVYDLQEAGYERSW
jgi:hypothetical protein